jgi:hypothetical protein
MSWGRSVSSRRAASSQRAAAWSSGWRRWWPPWVAWARVCERDGQGGGGASETARGSRDGSPHSAALLRSIAAPSEAVGGELGPLVVVEAEGVESLADEASGHTSCAGRRAAAGALPSTIASDEHEVAASSPCAPRGRASRAAAAPRRSRPCRARACASGPRSTVEICGAFTCAFASHVSSIDEAKTVFTYGPGWGHFRSDGTPRGQHCSTPPLANSHAHGT